MLYRYAIVHPTILRPSFDKNSKEEEVKRKSEKVERKSNKIQNK
jgi:hypothetical protein